MNKIILIDGSYFLFNCFFETKKHYKSRLNQNTEILDWNMDEYFIKKFTKKISSNFYRISVHFKVPFKNIIFVRDCPRETIWRLDMYEKYKQNRGKTVSHKKKTHYIGNLFKNIYSEYLPQFCNKTGIDIIKFDRLEADDVISIYAKKYAENNIVNIIARDKDYIQLISGNVYLYDLKFNKIGGNKNRNSLINKLIYGDSSDNITPSCKMKFTSDIEPDLMNILQKIDINKLFRNRRLIDFSCIPLNEKNIVLSKINNKKIY